ncbi:MULTISPECIES: aromatic-ring-hydroxylating dioxygenase subunit beta [Enterobacteriaceae]|nr:MULTISPECIES: aromatic-ring-hydroxylating dioxygenase subunit beta [Enterobacteriaceae]BBQ83867.1 anthranilate 1,2-dioxygenase small subunit [Klebsiella sp. WP3-W18-ESBL-02]BBR20828.1 anthranilate 1,2-dioxygenase small subunit [Klebsiella sp. WP3-S18-ESBL-05]BBT70924.1 anthranilate 1,2-dioxygenase small subunit [Klebsiella sp. WP8-S18-ESBL-06]
MMINNEIWQQLVALQTEYSDAVDRAEWAKWTTLFTEDCCYKVIPRENYDRQLPLCTINLESKGMLKDRIYGVAETLFHDPYYQRHVVGLPHVISVDEQGIVARTHYAVFRTKPDGHSEVFNVGYYLDTVVRTAEGLRFASRLCIFDSELVPNSLIYPI